MPKSLRSKKTKKRSKSIDWVNAPDVKKRILHLIKSLGIKGYNTSRIYCFRSENAKTRAYARIWGLGRVWQQALDIKPAYVLEVISEKFDRLDLKEKDNVLLHEIAHIPMNFSGALLPHTHRRRGAGNFHDKLRKMIWAFSETK